MTPPTSIRMTASMFVALVIGAATAGLSPGAVFHVLIATDTTAASGLGGDVARDSVLVESLFKNQVPPQQLRIVKLKEADLTPQGILNAVGALPITPGQDVVVFYYSGHGAFIDDPKVGHFFSLPGGQTLTRLELEEKIAARKPLVAATITDCCAVGMRFPGAIRGAAAVKVTQVVSPLFQHLFLKRRGLFSISSSKPGEYSLTRGDGHGSLFTMPFCEYLLKHKQERLNWDRVLVDVGQQVAVDFQKVAAAGQKAGFILKDAQGNPIHQDTQTVYAYCLTPALGMYAKEEGGKLQVTRVVPLSPAAIAGLLEGDVLQEINGASVTTEQQYSDAVDKSPPAMRLKFSRKDNAETAEIQVELNPI